MIKKWEILLAIGMLFLTACSEKETDVVSEEVEETKVVKEEKKELVVPEEIKKVVDDFVGGFIEQDYEKIVQYYTEETVEATGYKREELVKQLEENFETKHIEVTDYIITGYESFDDKDYVAFEMNVTYENGKLGKDPEEWIIVKVNGEYKFDSSLIIREIPLEMGRVKSFKAKFLFTDVKMYEEIGGYRFKSILENLSKTESYQFGKEDTPALATLVTNEGEYTVEIHDKTELFANHKGEVVMYFKEAKGVPLSIHIDGVYLLGEAGEVVSEGESFELKLTE